jgi:signal transduction histidine kinase/ligand-binding sensor domain-containing protein
MAKGQDPEIKAITFSDPPIGFLGMAQDKYGYIWLSDNGNGLYKYDGNNTIVYKPEPANPNSPASGRIENLIIDRDGNIWLAHFDSGLDLFDSETETFTHFRHDDKDSTTIYSDAVRDIVEDLDGNLWVGTNSGLDKFDKKTGKFIHNFSSDPDAEILRKEHVRKLYIDRSGIVWVGTGSTFFGEETTGGLFSLNPKTGEVNMFRHTEEENSLIDNRVRAIFEDSRGVFWIGTAGDGLHTMNREDGTFTRHTCNPKNPEKLSRPPIQNIYNFGVDHISFIGEDNEGCIWIGTYGNGINRYNPKTENTTLYGPNEMGKFKIGSASLWGFLKTYDGLLWITTFDANNPFKLYKINLTPNKLKFYNLNEAPTSAAQDSNGQLYFGTANGVCKIVNEELHYLFKIYDLQDQSNQGVREIAFDEKGNIWAGTSGAGLFYFNRKTNELINYRHEPGNKNSLSNDYIGTILPQENGEIFIGTSNGLDILVPENNNFEHFELKNTIFSNSSNQRFKWVTVDKHKRIWIAGEGGVYKFDRKTGIFKKYDLGIGNEIILNLFEDVDGGVWIGTINHGLRRFDDESDSFQPVLDETGYLNKYTLVLSVGQDKNKAIWLLSERVEQLIKYDIKSNQGTLYSDDWFPENTPNYLGGLMSLSNEEILLRTQDGYYKFHPDDFIQSESAIPKPFIEKIFIKNQILTATTDSNKYKSFLENSLINLSYNQNDLSFQIGYLDYMNNKGSQPVSYKLEGYDKEWRNAISGDMISYYLLPPNKYNLQIKAQDIYGNWGEKNLSIFIAPPWYSRWWAFVIYVLIFILGIIIVDRFQRKRLLSKERERTREKELAQAREIEKAYTELKSTQAQLIQSEKMASLGELTAGIAHEIQNPLNFVNNFSELSKELIVEMNEELAVGNNQLAKEIAGDIEQNLEKINHHGKRAADIVKGMLQHSRTSTGQKEPTDINALADEYLRLAYHGLRAKDKTFNADFKTDFDENLPKINVIPQDIGRVLLNLINNAFYAVDKRAKSNDPLTPEVGMKNDQIKFVPTVTICTTSLNPPSGGRGVRITVKDNGPGINKNIVDKIFQPFFTTKPTGQGTGLGLSLSYDIIKAHGGIITVNSKENEGTEFIIILPVKT